MRIRCMRFRVSVYFICLMFDTYCTEKIFPEECHMDVNTRKNSDLH